MSDNERPTKRARMGTNHGWCLTIKESGIDTFVESVNTWICDGEVNIAVVGDEIAKQNQLRHAQAFLNFPNRRGIAFGKLRRLLIDAGMDASDFHIEPRKSLSMARAGNYCLKEHYEHIAELFPEKGTVAELYRPGSTPLLVVGWDVEKAGPESTTAQGRRTDLDGFKEDVLAGRCRDYDDAMMNHSGLCIRSEGFVRMFIGRFAPIEAMLPEEWASLLADGHVRRWQAWLIHELANTDTSYRFRKVHVVTDGVRGMANGNAGGNAGKSHMCDWFPRLMANVGQKVQVIGPGKLADMAAQLQSDVDIVMIDIPASRSEALQWAFVEQLKAGRVDAPKYHSCTIVLKKRPVRVVILCNYHPDHMRRVDELGEFMYSTWDEYRERNPEHRYAPRQHTLSNDRWVEYNITSGHDLEPCPDFMLPAEMNFGPEFSSDNAGDGPVLMFHDDWWAEYINRWEDSAYLWSISYGGTGDVDTNTFKGSKLVIKEGNRLYEPVKRYFLSMGWDGEGTLEVIYGRRPPVDKAALSEFQCLCLECGIVKCNNPKGVVMYDAADRYARVWMDEFGRIQDLIAIDPSGVFYPELIHSYTIQRNGIFVYSFPGLMDYLRPRVMNGDFNYDLNTETPDDVEDYRQMMRRKLRERN